LPDRLVVDLGGNDGQADVLLWPDRGVPEPVSRAPLAWPLDAAVLEDLRWYLEDYLVAPFGVWEDRGPAVQAKLACWGDLLFGSVFGVGPARDAYQRARDRGLEVVFRSAEPGLLALPWELMRDGTGPVALGAGGISRSLPVADKAQTLEVAGGQLRVLMVISRPAGTEDVGFQMVARPLLERLETVRGKVSLTVLRPPTFDALREVVTRAADAGEPFHVVHFDGHGAMPGRVGSGAVIGGRPAMMAAPGEGVLAFELPGGGSDYVGASKVAAALAEGKVPVVVLNACQSGAVGKALEASVATALLNAGCAAVVAMAYSVYAVAAADFMAAFYESVFTGDSVGQAVTAGRRRLFSHNGRPSPRGDMPLADWLVPVHYMREEVRFPQACAARPASAPSLDEALDQIRAASSQPAATEDPLAAVGAFVGRDDLFYQLETAARLQHVVVLTGPGGTGKTELAKGFARWWRDTGGVDDSRLVAWHSFEPGFATFGLDGVIIGIGRALFGTHFARLDAPHRLDTVKWLLAQYRVLLVWDNFESVKEMPGPAGATPPLDEAGCSALKAFLEWVRDHSRSVVIITSRAQEEWLGPVRRILVGGLNRAEAARYAAQLLAPYPAAQARRERRSFGELLEWLNGHPLSMQLTLPRLDNTYPAELLARLRGVTPQPMDEDTGTGRLSSLGACITYSFAHLSGQTRRLLPAVSLLHGIANETLLIAFSAVEEVPARFAGVSGQEWTAALQDAARVGLLTPINAGMYQIHPALPGYLAAGWHAENPGRYGREREAGEQALCTACAVISVMLTGMVTSGNAALAYAVIGLQRRTLGAMLGRALDRHAWDEASCIFHALQRYCETRGLGEEAAAWADRILDAIIGGGQAMPAADTPTATLWLQAALQQASRQGHTGQPDQAERTYRQVLAYLQDQPQSEKVRRDTATTCHQLGMTVQDRGRLNEADDWYRKALAIFAELGDRRGMADTYHQLGITAQDRGELDEADDWYRKALTTYEELGDRAYTAGSYHQLGRIAQDRGRLDEAKAWYRKALTIIEELGNRPDMALCYHQLGSNAYLRGLLDEAEAWYRKALTIREELGDRRGMADTYHQLGITAQVRGLLDEAEAWYRKALTIREELGDRSNEAGAYHQLGRTAQDRGLLDEAEAWYRKALAIFTELSDLPRMARSYWHLGLLAEARQQPRQALEWTVQSVTLFGQFPHPATGPAPQQLARLTRQLGMPALEQAWRQVGGQPVPQQVRDYITSHHDDEDSGDEP
jgi:tetratricopeptide (TPR) repeat protein